MEFFRAVFDEVMEIFPGEVIIGAWRDEPRGALPGAQVPVRTEHLDTAEPDPRQRAHQPDRPDGLGCPALRRRRNRHRRVARLTYRAMAPRRRSR
ncbi:hypothetical protein [Amycolatopsis sp.]|uniref:hypothetical protein n=1 Tax=Amycolatopsis sp. TaxID=37632 RepID=UPI0039C8B995